MTAASQPPPRKVEYFFVGVGKCGTSWIYSVLKAKKAIEVPAIKEPYLIDQPEERRRKLERELWGEGAGRADFSNTYFKDPESAAKIRDYNPDARIIITVRRPSERTVSHFLHLQRNGQVPAGSLEEYLAAGRDEHEIVERSDYRQMIERYRSVFGADRVLVLPLEHLRKDAQDYIDRLTRFLGVARIELSAEDRAPVMVRSKPRFGGLGRVAKLGANLLRRMGLLKLLGAFKSSRLIGQLLYRPIDTVPAQSFGPRSAEVERLDRDYLKLLEEEGYTSASR